MEARAIELKAAGLCLGAVLLVESAATFVFGHFGLPSMAVLGIARLLQIALFVLIFREMMDGM